MSASVDAVGGLPCPRCQAGSETIETRVVRGGIALRRRRRCMACGYRFTTYELVAVPSTCVACGRPVGHVELNPRPGPRWCIRRPCQQARQEAIRQALIALQQQEGRR